MTKNRPEDRAQALILRFQGYPLRWFDNPAKYRFLRLSPKSGSRYPSSATSLGLGKTLVGVATGKQEMLLIYHRHGDFEAEAYRDFPEDPIAKPTEAVGSSAFMDGGYPRRTL